MSDLLLSQKVDQFKHDVTIVHQVTHGDKDTVVQTEGGPIRSLAKLIYDAGLSIDNFKVSLVTSHPKKIKDGMFTLDTPAIGGVVWNMALVFTNITDSDLNPDGSLKYDRDYEIEEHVGVVVSDDTVTVAIPGDSSLIENKFAQVSYVTCQS